MCGLAVPACAEVHVAGSRAAVRITISRDTISDVLSAIAATFNVRYRTKFPLDAVADATYSGSFGQVISRLLNGYNYVIKTDQGICLKDVIGQRVLPAGQPSHPPAHDPTARSVTYRCSDGPVLH